MDDDNISLLTENSGNTDTMIADIHKFSQGAAFKEETLEKYDEVFGTNFGLKELRLDGEFQFLRFGTLLHSFHNLDQLRGED